MSYQVSKKVFIKRKPSMSAFVNANEKTMKRNDSNWKIGAALARGGAVLKGVVFEDEKTYMPQITNLSPNDPGFLKSCDDYWNNISVYIPIGLGKELEIGFKYKTEEDLKKGEAFDTIENRQKYGEPISLEDYLLYRYCLVYSRVANSIEDIDKSNKIRFYLYTKEYEVKSKHNEFESQKKAMLKFLEILSDRTTVKTLMQVYERFDITDDREQDLFLNEKVKEDPNEFLLLVEDPELQIRAFIYKCINNGLLSRQPNTEVIMIDDTDILGHTLSEAIAHLKTERRQGVYTRLKAQLGGKYTDAVVVNPLDHLVGTKESAKKVVDPADKDKTAPPKIELTS